MKAMTTRLLRCIEVVVLSLGKPPLYEIYLAAIGYLMFPLYHRLFGQYLGYLSIWFIFGVLLGLKLVPAIVRGLLPFSERAQRCWANHRLLGKRYDSYQLRKLLWIGLGLVGYLAMFGNFGGLRGLLAVTCLLAGGIGWLVWQNKGISGLGCHD
ncbi:MAG: hypothetical protein P0111_07465 [Nitrospira sp.]|nr:hypothetical protein [Nitrospira sp.]